MRTLLFAAALATAFTALAPAPAAACDNEATYNVAFQRMALPQLAHVYGDMLKKQVAVDPGARAHAEKTFLTFESKKPVCACEARSLFEKALHDKGFEMVEKPEHWVIQLTAAK
jgi:hypothetical protein